MLDDSYYMRIALQEAEDAYAENEIPVGAVVVLDGQIVAKGHNLTETLKDVTAHAEMMALTSAANALGAKYLNDCTLYVTLEPCLMCAGAIAHAQVKTLVFGASDPKKGYSVFLNGKFPSKAEIRQGVLADECAQILKRFFAERR
ncbi:MAG: nucleoside deaminase [Bacteroidales bacterium]|nr:nucleoside deaminase [Bacteroidales bacterium]MCR4879054.1 nucleoside deaminase [Bacteroidales bacterium]